MKIRANKVKITIDKNLDKLDNIIFSTEKMEIAEKIHKQIPNYDQQLNAALSAALKKSAKI